MLDVNGARFLGPSKFGKHSPGKAFIEPVLAEVIGRWPYQLPEQIDADEDAHDKAR